MAWFATLVGYLAPVFVILSPVLSYGDQAVAMHRSQSTGGFSLDIPLIMLVASFLRIFYWPGARFDMSLLLQSVLMVFMQIILLKIGLDHRPPPSTKGGDGIPFSGIQPSQGGILDSLSNFQRPYNFWQWRSPKPYWQFLGYFLLGLCVMQLTMAPIHSIYPFYSNLIGVIGLSVEATLPLPQILANVQTKSCKGFRLSVLASWLIGDAMKMFWFFTATTEIPWAFKICGIFQASCDCCLGLQYFIYETPYMAHLTQYAQVPTGEADAYQMEQTNGQGEFGFSSKHSTSRSITPTRRPVQFHERSVE